MAKTKISEFSATPANNTDIDSINIAEGCAPSGINDAIRELMAQLKDFQTGAVGDSFNGPVGTSTAAAGAFTTLAASGAVTLSGGTASGVTYLNGSKVLTSGSALTFDGSKLTVSATSGETGLLTATGVSNYLSIKGDTGGTTIWNGIGTDTGVAWVGSVSNHSVSFRQNNTEGMRLTSTGLGIGTSSPSSKLVVQQGSGSYQAIQILASNAGEDAGMRFQGGGGNAFRIQQPAASRGLFFYDETAAATRLTIDSAGNLGLGVTPSAWTGNRKVVAVGGTVAAINYAALYGENAYNCFTNGTNYLYQNTGHAGEFNYSVDTAGGFSWKLAASGTAGNAITFTQAMTLTAASSLCVGRTAVYSTNTERLSVEATGNSPAILAINAAGATDYNYVSWNTATSGDNKFVGFFTEASPTLRGSITYNRAGGLTTYNTTSDYRAKDISGPVTGSGALIDSIPVYMGTMKGATQERPMFIAHETPAYAHTGTKDEVDADGNPVYQQMDASALIPVMWAEIQSLRQRLAAANL